MKKIILAAILFFMISVTNAFAGEYTITTTPEQDTKIAGAATYAGYTNVDTYVSMRGLEEIEAAAEAIKQHRASTLFELLYRNIDANDRTTLEQLADKYK